MTKEIQEHPTRTTIHVPQCRNQIYKIELSTLYLQKYPSSSVDCPSFLTIKRDNLEAHKLPFKKRHSIFSTQPTVATIAALQGELLRNIPRIKHLNYCKTAESTNGRMLGTQDQSWHGL